MAEKTKIEWTRGEDGSLGSTWNPVTGCTPVSDGCRNCYARRMATRLRGRYGYPHDDPFRVTVHEERMTDPLRWKKPRRIFVASMGDLFHDDVPNEVIDRVVAVMALCPQHVFMVLTKRARRMKEYFERTDNREEVIGEAARSMSDGAHSGLLELPLSNLWLGVTAENQEAADERVPVLVTIPALGRFVSCEPLLGQVYLSQWISGLHLVVIGGETGPGARPMRVVWVESLLSSAQQHQVGFCFKGWGDGGAGR